jgi:hypothetical protein
MSPQMGLDTKTYWLTDRQSQCDLDLDFDFGFDNKTEANRAELRAAELRTKEETAKTCQQE